MRNCQIDDAIALMAGRRRAFSAKDIAEFEEWEGWEATINEALRRQCQSKYIIRLDDTDEDSCPRYLSTEAARSWWSKLTLRLVSTNVDYLTTTQLAKSMSLAFGNGYRLENPPKSLLDVGKQWALVSDGCAPDTYVFPWVTLIRWDIRFERVMNSLTSMPNGSWNGYTIESAIDEVLCTLRAREARIIQLRFGFIDGRKYTLEGVGREFGVTRERIRQIEAKALRKLRHPMRSRVLMLGIGAEFVRSGGSLLLFESEKKPCHMLLRSVFGNTSEYIPELGVSVIASVDLWNCKDFLQSEDAYKLDDQKLADFLPFLSRTDADRLRKPIESHKQNIIDSWSRPRMILEALRSLGRAAHFQEIAQRCNEMFPDKASTIHNWHGAMDRSERHGIVWIGRKGMYGLMEHGYSRPSKDLFDSAADIVEDKFSKTHQPVAEEVVIEELSKIRRELNPNSVVMALSFNDRLTSLGHGKFVPRRAPTSDLGQDASPRYDISAALKAFSVEED